MKKIALALALIAISSAANAVQLQLISHEVISQFGGMSTLVFTDGSNPAGISPPSTASWNWDGTTLSSNGMYSAELAINSASPFRPVILNDQIIDLSIDTSTSTATATSYTCVEGNFLAGVGANGCGDYTLGPNFIDESTTIWSGLKPLPQHLTARHTSTSS